MPVANFSSVLHFPTFITNKEKKGNSHKFDRHANYLIILKRNEQVPELFVGVPWLMFPGSWNQLGTQELHPQMKGHYFWDYKFANNSLRNKLSINNVTVMRYRIIIHREGVPWVAKSSIFYMGLFYIGHGKHFFSVQWFFTLGSTCRPSMVVSLQWSTK